MWSGYCGNDGDMGAGPGAHGSPISRNVRLFTCMLVSFVVRCIPFMRLDFLFFSREPFFPSHYEMAPIRLPRPVYIPSRPSRQAPLPSSSSS